jgi:serine/threonine protein kinase
MVKKSSRGSGASKTRRPGKLSGQTIPGKYRLGNLIGINRAGSLYEAKTLLGDDALAVLALAPGTKVVLPLNIDSTHPNLVNVRDLIEENGKPLFVVLDEPRGKTLRQLIDKRGRMEPGPAIATTMQLLSALHFLHGRNRIHGALDPTWVFLQQDPHETLRLLLVDVGYLGRDELPPLPFYTAPELVLGESNVDHRSDIWSLGVILFEMVYGHRPFMGRDKEEICSRILLKDPPFPDTPAKIPDDLVATIRKMLEKDPEDRYQNVTMIIGDLLMLHEEYEETLDDDVARVLRESLVPPPLPPSAKTKPAAKKPVANLETEDEDLATTLTMQRSDRSPPQPPKPEPKPVAKKPVADKKTTVKQDGKKTVIGVPSPIFPVKSLAAEAAKKRTVEASQKPATEASPKPEPKPAPAKSRSKTKSKYLNLGAEPVSLDDKIKPAVPIEDIPVDLDQLEAELEEEDEELATTLPMQYSDTSPDRRRLLIIAGGAALAILLIVIIVVAASVDDDEVEPGGASAAEVDKPKPEPEVPPQPLAEAEPEVPLQPLAKVNEPEPEPKPEPELEPEIPPQPLAETDEPEPKTSVKTAVVPMAPATKSKKMKKKKPGKSVSKKKAATGLASNPWGD